MRRPRQPRLNVEARASPSAITCPSPSPLRRHLPVARLHGPADEPPRRPRPEDGEAERGPVIQILSRFNDIHRDREIRANFEVFRHVVFDFHGDYYVAVPLDAPPRQEPVYPSATSARRSAHPGEPVRELRKGKNLHPHARSRPPARSRSGWPARAASSQARAFRVYRFRDGAYSQIILGAVMGAARRVEAEEDDVRSSRQPDLPRPAARVLPDAPVPKPETPAPSVERHARRRRPTLSIDPQHAMRFGPYAETYWPDPASPPYYTPPRTRRTPAAQPEADTTVKAANSNTARTAPVMPPPSRNTIATVVPMPRAQHSAQANDDTNSQSVRDPAVARVTLQRETATFTVPVSEAAIPNSLKVALAGADQNWANVVSAGQRLTLSTSCPRESRPRPAKNRRRASPKTSFLPRTGPSFAASHHRPPNEKCFDRKRDNWLRHKSTRAATLA